MKKDLKCYCCLANFDNQKDLTAHIIECGAAPKKKAEQIESPAGPTSNSTLSYQRPILPKLLISD